jgi:hypothetical protein
VKRSKNDCDRPTVKPANWNGLKVVPPPVAAGVVFSAPKRM